LATFDEREKLVLASNSPRRAEILRNVGWPFEILPADVLETRLPNEGPLAYVRRLAQAKASVVASLMAPQLVLGADTIVVVDGMILGQPADAADARRMLRLLQGRWHEVLTGVALVRHAELPTILVEHEITRVCFATISEEQIEWYVRTGEPLDKAGAYAAQGKGALFIREIQGDYFNVVGLPVRLVYEMTRRINSGNGPDGEGRQ
jgi:nucleoside triphosphate pyrophosphatase